MSEVGQELKREGARLQDVAFKIFAVVGFLSSVVTIISWLASTQATLVTTITSTNLEIPTELQISNIKTSSYDLDSAISDLDTKYCSPVEVDFNGEKSRNYSYSPEKCETSKKLLSAIKTISSLDGKKLVAYDVEVTNDGRDVAENITLRTPVKVSARASDTDGNPVNIESSSSNRVFSLPDLNPKESLNIRLVSSTPIPEKYDPEIGKPSITFSGGIASNREFIYISGRYSGIIGFLDDLPTVLQIIVIVVAAMFITMIWAVPAAYISEANEKRKAHAKAKASGDAD